MVQWQHSAWVSTMRNEYAPNGGKFYVDRPPVPIQRAVRNILILLAAAGIVAFFLNRQIGLTVWQIFLIIVGFSLLYRNSTFLWSTNHLHHHRQWDRNLFCPESP